MATHLGLLLDIKGHTTDEKEILKGIRAHFHSIAPNEETEKAYLDSLQAAGINLTADELKYVLRKRWHKPAKIHIRPWRASSTT